MKSNTKDKFKKWCYENYADCTVSLPKCFDDFPSYTINYENECYFTGVYGDGFFILKLLDFEKGHSPVSDNGIEIRELIWNDEQNDYRWYKEGGKSNVYKVLLRTDLSGNGIQAIKDWIFEHTDYTEFPTFDISDFDYLVKDFIYKVNESKALTIETEHDSIDDFFESSFISGDSLNIKAANIDLTIITIEKTIVNNKEAFRFIIDIATDDNDEFKIRTTFDSQDKFKSLLKATISALKEYKQFAKYADELENCA